MAVQLLTPTFGTVAMAKNPVIFKLRSTGAGFVPYAAQGASTKLSAAAGDRFATGGDFTIIYIEPDGTTETVVFTATSTFTGEDEIPDIGYSGSATQYWQTIQQKIQKHHRIAPYFTVTRSGPIGGNSITLKSKSSDPAWEITSTNSEGFTITDTAAVADTTPVNYLVLFEIYFERTYGGGDFVQAAKLKNTPDSDGYLSFDISSILEAECRAGLVEPIVPEWGTSESIPGGNLRRFYIRFTEQYGTPIVPQEWEYDTVRVCMNGGVSQSIWAQGAWSGDYLGGLDADNCILTWMPDGKKIGLTQPEFLAWYNWDSEDRYVVVEMRSTPITTGVTSAVSHHLSEIRVKPQEVALLPVNPTILGLDTDADVYQYQVRVVYEDVGGFISMSPWRTYNIDRDYYHSERYVQYLNGFGVPESWRCTGVWSKKLNVQRSVAERPLLPDFNEFATDRFQYAKVWDHELTYRTGFLRRSEADVLQEMLIAGEIYDVSADGHIPLLIETNSFNVTDTEEDLHAYQFAARPRMDTRNYSKINTDNALTGAWQEPGGEAWFDALMIPWELP